MEVSICPQKESRPNTRHMDKPEAHAEGKMPAIESHMVSFFPPEIPGIGKALEAASRWLVAKSLGLWKMEYWQPAGRGLLLRNVLAFLKSCVAEAILK